MKSWLRRSLAMLTKEHAIHEERENLRGVNGKVRHGSQWSTRSKARALNGVPPSAEGTHIVVGLEPPCSQ